MRKRYIQLSKENHPDLLISKGVPPEVIEESKKKNEGHKFSLGSNSKT